MNIHNKNGDYFLKRVYILVVLIFSLFAIFTFKSASFVSANAQTSFVEISTIDGLQNIEENRNYKLVNDIAVSYTHLTLPTNSRV